MSRETSFQGPIQHHEEDTPSGEPQDTFLQELVQLEADFEDEEAAFKNSKVLSGTENQELFEDDP